MTEFSRSSNRRPPCAATGFTLVELAIGIAIITLLLGSLLVPLQNQVESRKLADTQKILDNAREALIGYAAAYGYFPCPADFAGGSNGAEAAGANHGNSGSCPASVTGSQNVYVGYLPAATLGLTPVDAQGQAVDAWGSNPINRIRYAVSGQNVSGVTRPFVSNANSPNGMPGAGMANILGANLLYVCNTTAGSGNTSCPSATTLTGNAIAVIWSLGPNAATTGGTSADEAENAEVLANVDRVWVMRDKSTVAATEFDDLVVWISTPILFSRLLAAGKLP